MALLYAGSTGLTFLVGALLARLLGVSGYGVYALAMTTVTLVGLLTEFGLPTLAMREAGAARAHGDWRAVRGLIGWADQAILFASLILIVVTWAGCLVLSAGDGVAYLDTLIWAIVLVPLVAIAKLRSFVLLALDRVALSQLPVMILRPALFLIGCLILWRVNGVLTPTLAMIAQVIGAAAVVAVILWAFHLHQPQDYRLAAPDLAVREWLAACLPMGLTEGLRLLQGQFALILTGLLAGAAQAGLYRVADAVVQITVVTSAIVGTAATPIFGRLWSSQDRVTLSRIAILSAWAMTAGAFVVGLPVALAGDWLFPQIFGKDFSASMPVFLILWGGAIFAGCFGVVLAVANMTGRHILSTQSFGVIALTNLAAALFTVPAWGAVGAAAACVAGLVAGNVFCAVRLASLTGMNVTLFNAEAPAVLWDALRAGSTALLHWNQERFSRKSDGPAP